MKSLNDWFIVKCKGIGVFSAVEHIDRDLYCSRIQKMRQICKLGVWVQLPDQYINKLMGTAC